MRKIIPLVAFTLLGILLCSVTCKSQLLSTGSYSIAAICKDGIVIGADTRGASYYQAKGIIFKEPLAYYDTIQKVFIVKNYVLSTTGAIIIGDKFVSYYIKQFSLSLPDDVNMQSFIKLFYNFMGKNCPSFGKEFLDLQIIWCGYENRKPEICAIRNGHYQCIVDSGSIQTDSANHFGDSYSRKLTCNEATKLIENSIYRHAQKHKLTYSIGGPIMILKITPDNKIEWLKNKKLTPNLDTKEQLYQACKNNKLNIHFTSPENKIIFDSAFFNK